jgi:predicted membrane metal-binding protein
MGSERSFGLVFAAVFGLIGVWPAVHLGWSPQFEPGLVRIWSLAIAGLFLAAGLLTPALLAPLNRLWFMFGMLLSRVMTPLVMGVVFVLTVIPTALVMRLRGRDLLRLKIDRQAKSYWILREPPGPAGDTMRNQY